MHSAAALCRLLLLLLPPPPPAAAYFGSARPRGPAPGAASALGQPREAAPRVRAGGPRGGRADSPRVLGREEARRLLGVARLPGPLPLGARPGRAPAAPGAAPHHPRAGRAWPGALRPAGRGGGRGMGERGEGAGCRQEPPPCRRAPRERGRGGGINVCESGTEKRGGRCYKLGAIGSITDFLVRLELSSVSVQDGKLAPDNCWL